MKTAYEWQKECVYIERAAGKRGLVPEMNNDTDIFIRYCEIQRDYATRDKQHDTATYIQHILEDMRAEQPAKTIFLHGRTFRPDGTADSMWTKEVPCKTAPLPHHKAGLSFTATGYGRRIPSQMLVFFNGKWRRVYVCCFSNSGTSYIGQWITGRGAGITVSEG